MSNEKKNNVGDNVHKIKHSRCLIGRYRTLICFENLQNERLDGDDSRYLEHANKCHYDKQWLQCLFSFEFSVFFDDACQWMRTHEIPFDAGTTRF